MWQHAKLSKWIHPRDKLCMLVGMSINQPTNQYTTNPHPHSSTHPPILPPHQPTNQLDNQRATLLTYHWTLTILVFRCSSMQRRCSARRAAGVGGGGWGEAEGEVSTLLAYGLDEQGSAEENGEDRGWLKQGQTLMDRLNGL